jgi:hypothetical protein
VMDPPETTDLLGKAVGGIGTRHPRSVPCRA